MRYICHDRDMNQVNRLALHAFVNAQARQTPGLLIEVLSVLRSDVIAFYDEYLSLNLHSLGEQNRLSHRRLWGLCGIEDTPILFQHFLFLSLIDWTVVNEIAVIVLTRIDKVVFHVDIKRLWNDTYLSKSEQKRKPLVKKICGNFASLA